MSPTDQRRPALVRADFQQRIADLLTPRGFTVKAKGDLVRRQGKNKHQVGFSSSHRNLEGDVTCWVSFWFEDGAVRVRQPGWRAGGFLTGHRFDGALPWLNIAVAEDADALAALVVARLDFFDQMENPHRVLAEVSRRYVPGIIDPSEIVPYLTAHLGSEAACSYARALLLGRPELWPAFASAREQAVAPSQLGLADHGTQLAHALAAEQAGLELAVPADMVSSTDPRAASGRSFLGLQLRAWGEPEGAAALRHLPDDEVHQVLVAQKAVDEPLVDSLVAAQLVLRAVLAEDRPPRRRAPDPRYFQYYPLHGPFA